MKVKMCNSETTGRHPKDNDLIVLFVGLIIIGVFLAFKL